MQQDNLDMTKKKWKNRTGAELYEQFSKKQSYCFW